jgi:hypothetical protein
VAKGFLKENVEKVHVSLRKQKCEVNKGKEKKTHPRIEEQEEIFLDDR